MARRKKTCEIRIKSRIPKIMADKGVTWAQMEEQGISPRLLSMAIKDIENRKLATLVRIAKILGVRVKDLFEEEQLAGCSKKAKGADDVR